MNNGMKVYHLELTEAHLKIINDAVTKEPYYIAAPFISELNDQLRKQLEAAMGNMQAPVEEPQGATECECGCGKCKEEAAAEVEAK